MLSGGEKPSLSSFSTLPEHQQMMNCFILNECGILLACGFKHTVFINSHSLFPCFTPWLDNDVVWDCNWLILPAFWNVQKMSVVGVSRKKLRQPGTTWSCQLIKMITLQKCAEKVIYAISFHEMKRPTGSFQQHIVSQFIIFCPGFHSFGLFFAVCLFFQLFAARQAWGFLWGAFCHVLSL